MIHTFVRTVTSGRRGHASEESVGNATTVPRYLMKIIPKGPILVDDADFCLNFLRSNYG